MPLVPGFTHVPANKLNKLEAALTDNTAAVVMKVVQGEGGVPMGGDSAPQFDQSPPKKPYLDLWWKSSGLAGGCECDSISSAAGNYQ